MRGTGPQNLALKWLILFLVILLLFWLLAVSIEGARTIPWVPIQVTNVKFALHICAEHWGPLSSFQLLPGKSNPSVSGTSTKPISHLSIHRHLHLGPSVFGGSIQVGGIWVNNACASHDVEKWICIIHFRFVRWPNFWQLLTNAVCFGLGEQISRILYIARLHKAQLRCTRFTKTRCVVFWVGKSSSNI